jgi:hypothetical protein
VERERELDRAEVRPQMTAVLRDRFDDEVTDLTGERTEVLVGQVAEIRRGVDAFEEHVAVDASCARQHAFSHPYPSFP